MYRKFQINQYVIAASRSSGAHSRSFSNGLFPLVKRVAVIKISKLSLLKV
jgi:hypothetical protein